jgi:hypothetical protein
MGAGLGDEDETQIGCCLDKESRLIVLAARLRYQGQ